MISMGTTQHQQPVVAAHWLVELDFAGGLVYLTTAPIDVTTAGHTYTGMGSHMSVSTVGESEDPSAEKITLTVPVVNSAMLALVMADATTYRGRPARLYLQLFDGAFVPQGSRVARWAGYMEPVRINRTPAAPGSANSSTASGSIELPCQRAGMARARNYQGLRITHSQRQQLFAGDLGLQYMQSLIEAPALWLSKRFQEI